jgi:PAS domain S-box-containing protein
MKIGNVACCGGGMHRKKGSSERVEDLTNSADHLTDIVWTIKSSGQISFSNRQWHTFAGIDAAAEHVCQLFPPISAIHPGDLKKLVELWNEAQTNSTAFSLEVRLKRASDKQYIWHLMRVWPVFQNSSYNDKNTHGNGGKATRTAPGHWLAISTDVHTFKTVQSMFQLVMDNIPISIFWKDRNSAYLGCNRLFASDVGQETTEALIGKNDYDNPSSKEQSDFFIQCDRRVMESDVAEYHIIEPQLRSDGKQAWLDTNKIPLHDAGGKVIGVLGMYEDITGRITIEQQREDFVATLTHDLKNPLLGTNRMLDLLVAGKLGEIDARQIDILKQVRESNSTLIHMIQNLLDVYRYESVALIPENEHVNLSHLLDTAVTRNQLTARAKGIKLTLNVPNRETVAEVSMQAIDRVVQNLLDNALKFTPEQGQIEVKLHDLGNQRQIEVKDSGPGVDLEEQKQLFNRFWQGIPGKKYSHGTGLGLYICKQIVEAHRGKIVCNSIPGRGTSFLVTLPTKALAQN